MANQSHSGIQRLVNAARFSYQGILATFKNEAAFRQECALLLLSIPLAAWVAESALTFVLLIGAIVFVMIVELLNSAVESVVDRVSEEHHALSGRAKDQGSAAVLLSVIVAASIWAAVLLL